MGGCRWCSTLQAVPVLGFRSKGCSTILSFREVTSCILFEKVFLLNFGVFCLYVEYICICYNI